MENRSPAIDESWELRSFRKLDKSMNGNIGLGDIGLMAALFSCSAWAIIWSHVLCYPYRSFSIGAASTSTSTVRLRARISHLYMLLCRLCIENTTVVSMVPIQLLKGSCKVCGELFRIADSNCFNGVNSFWYTGILYFGRCSTSAVRYTSSAHWQ